MDVIITAIIIGTAMLVLIIVVGLFAQKAEVTTGENAFIGKTGVVLSDLDPEGSIRIYGEIWKAESKERTIKKGEKVLVTRIKDFKLYVKPYVEEN